MTKKTSRQRSAALIAGTIYAILGLTALVKAVFVERVLGFALFGIGALAVLGTIRCVQVATKKEEEE